MSATILEGPAVAEAISEDVMNRVTALAAQGVTPCLGILRVGERPDDLSYERGACKRAEVTGIAVRHLVFDEGVTTEELVEAVEAINADDSVHGLLILRPRTSTKSGSAMPWQPTRTSTRVASVRSVRCLPAPTGPLLRARRRPASRFWTTTASRSRAGASSSSGVAL